MSRYILLHIYIPLQEERIEKNENNNENIYIYIYIFLLTKRILAVPSIIFGDICPKFWCASSKLLSEAVGVEGGGRCLVPKKNKHPLQKM